MIGPVGASHALPWRNKRLVEGLVDQAASGYVRRRVFERHGDRWVYANEAVEGLVGDDSRPASAHYSSDSRHG